MPMTGDKERAANYEALAILTGERERAYRLTMALPDPERPLDDAAEALGEVIGCSRDKLIEVRRAVADAFMAERIPSRILFPESPDFPEQKGERFPVIYAAGDLSLLGGERVTLVGMPKPSMQGRHDTSEALSYFVKHGVTVLTTLDDGIPAYAAEKVLADRGRVIASLSGPLSRCSASDAPLQSRIFSTGLLLSVFPPSMHMERWLVMIRNSFTASISSAVLLTEEKDGGPAWAVFDKVLTAGGRAMLSSSMLSVPSYTWSRKRVESGALTYSSDRDLRRLVPHVKRAGDVPDLFS